MPRSWIQSLSRRVGRLLWRRVAQTSVAPVHIVALTRTESLALSFKTAAYGGIFWMSLPVVHALTLANQVSCRLLQTQWPDMGRAAPVDFPPPQVSLGSFPTGVLKTASHRLHTVLNTQLAMVPMPTLHTDYAVRHLSIPPLPAPPLAKETKVPPLKFKPKHFASSCKFKTLAAKRPLAKTNFPVVRRPVQLQNYPTAMRRAFRIRLAEKTGILAGDIKITGVYDRLYLGIFQTLSHGDAGELICVPRPLQQIPNSAVATVPMYLVVGHAIDKPNQLLQVVIPMPDLEAEVMQNER